MSKQRKGAGRLDGQAATEITHIAKKNQKKYRPTIRYDTRTSGNIHKTVPAQMTWIRDKQNVYVTPSQQMAEK